MKGGKCKNLTLQSLPQRLKDFECIDTLLCFTQMLVTAVVPWEDWWTTTYTHSSVVRHGICCFWEKSVLLVKLRAVS